MGHLEAERILLGWRDVDTSLTSESDGPTGSASATGTAKTAPASSHSLPSTGIIVLAVVLPVSFLVAIVATVYLILRHRRLRQKRGNKPLKPILNSREPYVGEKSELPAEERREVPEMPETGEGGDGGGGGTGRRAQMSLTERGPE
jgi:hypothetical protein